MEKHYHILNGDSLKQQFPKQVRGELIVARECLVDGEVRADTLDEFFEKRARFISRFYGDYTTDEYYSDTVSEFEKIKRIQKHSTINLWFEDDLFCQVNLWFVVYLLLNYVQDHNVFLIRPPVHTSYGFAGLNEAALMEALEKKVEIIEMDKLAMLWSLYQHDDIEKLRSAAKELSTTFPFILPAVEAHLARIPTEGNPGRPIQALIEIMQELETKEFGPVFREFNKRESIYGFGDLQVKRLFDELKTNR